MLSNRIFCVVATLNMVLGVFGHMDDEMASHSEESHDVNAQETDPTTYFALETHQLAIRVHICLMIISWLIILPIATMLSLARSRHTHVARLVFMATNIIGIVFGVSYKNTTPDLYPGSAHSAVGWIATGIAAAQISHLLIGPMTTLLDSFAGLYGLQNSRYMLYSTQTNTQNQSNHNGPSSLSRQASFDGEGSRRYVDDDSSPNSHLYREASQDLECAREDSNFMGASDSVPALQEDPSAAIEKIFSKPSFSRTRNIVLLVYDILDSTIMIMAFITICTGIVTYGGLFKGKAIFNGIAHWIKGGVFFWLGIFNLGRWCGCFAKLGWAWNIRPTGPNRQSWLSAEFIESSLIFFYGSTNIFLEHLAGRGGAWTARDLEHVSITVLFIGGGLAGILVEFTRVRGLANQTARPGWSNDISDEHIENKRGGISMNPLPALVIFLMGSMMASHKQSSMESTMVHKQWGNLLGAASIARLVTYMILFLKPPTSVLPSRPPTELLSAFGMIAGGITFMASSSDTINGMIHYEVDVMAVYTVTMGFTGLIMAWIIALLAIKGWASR